MMRDDWECSFVQWQDPFNRSVSILEKPSWTPIVLSGAVPRDASDLLAMAVMGTVALELALAAIGPVFTSRLLLSLLVVPPTCALASISATTRRMKEELALFAYGGSGWQILLRYFFRGSVCAVVAFSPVIIEWTVSLGSPLQLIAIITTLVLSGGLFYSLPSLRRIRSSSFVGHYKS
jgi:hypothetical protein